MAFIDITSIEMCELSGEGLRSVIDIPQPAIRIEGYFLTIAGWVTGPNRPIAGVTIRLDDGLFVTSGAMIHRFDVNKHLGLADHVAAGFRITLNVISLPTEFALTIEAKIDEGPRDVRIAVIHGRRSRPGTSFQPSLEPLSVTSLGRTGTTLLVRMLAAHPAILTQSDFPYETRVAGWWMQALTSLWAQAHESSHPDAFLDRQHTFFLGFNSWKIGSQPDGPALHAWVRDQAVEEIAGFCMQQIEQTYLRIAADQDEQGSRYFVEKAVPTHAPRMLRQLYEGSREIFLVRDFRDMVCSMDAFDRKRKQTDFRRSDGDAESFLARIVADFRRLIGSWEERRESSLLVRYEDIVLDPESAMRRITDYLEVDSSQSSVAAMLASADSNPDQVMSHRTTPTLAMSINRYRRDMDPLTLERSLELGGDLLKKLGYLD